MYGSTRFARGMSHPAIAHPGDSRAPTRPRARALCALRQDQMISRTVTPSVT